MLSPVRSILLALLTTLALALVSGAARAEYAPPPLRGHVVDRAGKLTAQEIAELNRKLEGVNLRTGDEIAVYIPASLEGNTIEDVGYYTFQSWKLGKKDKDNGVLLTIAPAERKIYITTGKGVGDKITDIQARDITLRVGAHLKLGQFYAGVDEGTSLIAIALGDKLTAPPPPVRDPGSRRAHSSNGPSVVHVAVLVAIVVLVLFLLARARRRRGYDDDDGPPPFIFFGGGGGGGGWGGGGGGDGGGFSGGGGETGGGGAGSDY